MLNQAVTQEQEDCEVDLVGWALFHDKISVDFALTFLRPGDETEAAPSLGEMPSWLGPVTRSNRSLIRLKCPLDLLTSAPALPSGLALE